MRSYTCAATAQLSILPAHQLRIYQFYLRSSCAFINCSCAVPAHLSILPAQICNCAIVQLRSNCAFINSRFRLVSLNYQALDCVFTFFIPQMFSEIFLISQFFKYLSPARRGTPIGSPLTEMVGKPTSHEISPVSKFSLA